MLSGYLYHSRYFENAFLLQNLLTQVSLVRFSTTCMAHSVFISMCQRYLTWLTVLLQILLNLSLFIPACHNGRWWMYEFNTDNNTLNTHVMLTVLSLCDLWLVWHQPIWHLLGYEAFIHWHSLQCIQMLACSPVSKQPQVKWVK